MWSLISAKKSADTSPMRRQKKRKRDFLLDPGQHGNHTSSCLLLEQEEGCRCHGSRKEPQQCQQRGFPTANLPEVLPYELETEEDPLRVTPRDWNLILKDE